MELLNIILTAVIAILGYPIGLLVAKLTKEELKPGRKYFIWLNDILLILAAVFIVLLFQLQIYISIIAIILITIIVIRFHPKPLISCPLLALFFILSTKTENIFFIISSIIFVYNLTLAGLRK